MRITEERVHGWIALNTRAMLFLKKRGADAFIPFIEIEAGAQLTDLDAQRKRAFKNMPKPSRAPATKPPAVDLWFRRRHRLKTVLEGAGRVKSPPVTGATPSARGLRITGLARKTA